MCDGKMDCGLDRRLSKPVSWILIGWKLMAFGSLIQIHYRMSLYNFAAQHTLGNWHIFDTTGASEMKNCCSNLSLSLMIVRLYAF